MRGPGTAKTKHVWCTHCGGLNEVAQRAMSVFCAHCHKRLILENLVIKSYQALKTYATCGDVLIERRGRVNATIQSNKLTVKGIVQGNVEARGPVEVAATGRLVGDVNASALLVREGASVEGFCEIRPLAALADEALPAVGGEDSSPTSKRASPPAASGDGRPASPKVKAIVTGRRRSSPGNGKP